MTASLYQRLGGYDGIATFATSVIALAREDDLLGRFWLNRGEDRNQRELQLLIDFFVRETGGRMYYRGRDMALAHKGMGVSEADWDRLMEIAGQVAGSMGVGPTEGGEVMAFFDSLKPEIVTA